MSKMVQKLHPDTIRIPDGPLDNVRKWMSDIYHQYDFKSKDDFRHCIQFIKRLNFSIRILNNRITSAISECGADKVDAVQKEHPSILFTCYPYLVLCDYLSESHSFVLHKNINIEYNKIRKKVLQDTFNDLIDAYLLLHPDCIRWDIRVGDMDGDVDLQRVDYLQKDIDYSDGFYQRGKKKIPIMRNGIIIPRLPIAENRCLWCGKKIIEDTKQVQHDEEESVFICNDTGDKIYLIGTDYDSEITWGNKKYRYVETIHDRYYYEEFNQDVNPGRIRYYCSSGCKQKDSQFKKKYNEMLVSADPEYVKFMYYWHVLLNGRGGKVIPGITQNSVTMKDVMYDYVFGQIPHQIIMSWLRGPCKECGHEIPLDKPIHAEYCCTECSEKGRKKKYYHSHKN